ncbi:hypothetical protein [Aeromicrobium sp. P5_D10]
MPDFLPEYPSLSIAERAMKSSVRLKKSRRHFEGTNPLAPKNEQWLLESIGPVGDFTHASTRDIQSWLEGWRMPHEDSGEGDLHTSASVFVGVVDSSGMPESSRRGQSNPFVVIPTHFVQMCSKVADVFPTFSLLVSGSPSATQAWNARELIFDYLGPATPAGTKNVAQVRACRDELFTARTTASAVRWAIAHEMAHVVATKQQRADAYNQVAQLWPGMAKEQWVRLRNDLGDYRGSLEAYKNEIACDLLANQYVLESAFAADDLMTQVSGALLALQTSIWEGWLQDRSAISQTHPSPTLRYKLVYLAWLNALSNPATWIGREAPGPLGLEDFAMWNAFQRWVGGEYGDHRDGAQWNSDMHRVRAALHAQVPTVAAEQIYGRLGSRLIRIPEALSRV